MLVVSFSVSPPSLVLWPSPHHDSPFQVTNSCFFRSPGRPELSRVYKPPLEKRAERHFKGHGFPQASVLSREIGLTTLLPALLPASSPFFPCPSPVRTRPFFAAFRRSASGSGDSVRLKGKGAGIQEGGDGGGGNQRILSS